MKKMAGKLFFIVFLFVVSSLKLHAQPGDPGNGDPEDIPLDPGTWVLVAAGAGYGLKKWRDAKHSVNKKEMTKDIALLQKESEQNVL